jgi:hypothetical protein
VLTRLKHELDLLIGSRAADGERLVVSTRSA